MDVERFIVEFSRLSDMTIIELLEEALKDYKKNPPKYREDLMALLGLLMVKLHGETPEEIMETFKHFKSFENLAKFTGGQN